VKKDCFFGALLRFLLLLFVFNPLWGWASVETRQAHSQARLVIEDNGVEPGKSLALGLHLTLDEGWHSYWSNPGDSGSPPLFQWTLPEGFSIQGPFYVPPQRIQVGALTSFGYTQETFYRFELSNSLKKQEGACSFAPVDLILDAEWLVCEKTCIPAKHRFSLSLNLCEKAEPTADAVLIARFQNELPISDDQFQFSWSSQEATLQVRSPKPIEAIDVFPLIDFGVGLKKPKIETKNLESFLSFEKTQDALLPESLPQRAGLLVFREGGQGQKTKSVWIENQKPVSSALSGLMGAFGLAFLGGLLLNLMPCVFPVLSIKVFSVLEQAGKGKAWVRHSSLIYASGIFVSFMALGLILAALRSWGEAVGWGFQLQNPYLLVVLIFLFAVLGASFLGAIDLSWLQIGAGQSLASQSGWMGEFFSGVLCVIVASPCTAPFMGAALGYAISQPLGILLTVFLALGLGLSFPYLLLALLPQAAKVLPRPGRWMETVKEVMAFPLFATVIWLLWILSQSATPFTPIGVLVALLVFSLGIWFRKRNKPRSWKRGFGAFLQGAALVGSLFLVREQLKVEVLPTGISISHGIQWQAFSKELAEKTSLSGQPVFVDFTASWCVTCQVNEEVTFSSDRIKAFIKEKNILMLKADWTKADPLITEALKSYNRIGVPYYVVYPPGVGRGEGIGEVLTPKIFEKAFQK